MEMQKIKPINSFEENNSELVGLIVNQFKLDLDSAHGISHWRRVREIGDYLAKQTGADIEVLTLFAYLHDSKRENENDEPYHGLRAMVFMDDLYKKGLLGNLSTGQWMHLMTACTFHCLPNEKSGDITVQTCWDADRLDLWRVGIEPQKQFLNTDFAKQDNVIQLWNSFND